ncbi:hypothetical protein [uncultured Olegusella sp.]|uniref:hypothetical protein n=1 Tax=uncultured Olegusella sp. TaxID=1979846 RepID=UPI002637285F|nr:hypothetical protein [uncultured Olegusella sp.]
MTEILSPKKFAGSQKRRKNRSLVAVGCAAFVIDIARSIGTSRREEYEGEED